MGKEGRNTVIQGLFGCSNPYARAADLLALCPWSPENCSQLVLPSSYCSTQDILCLFLLACNAAFKSLNRHNIRAPILGGGSLDMRRLQNKVLLLGGPQNIVNRRVLRVAAQQLEHLVTCAGTSHSLKRANERPSYHYEQTVLLDRLPQNEEPVRQEESSLRIWQPGRGKRKKRPVK